MFFFCFRLVIFAEIDFITYLPLSYIYIHICNVKVFFLFMIYFFQRLVDEFAVEMKNRMNELMKSP